MKSKVTCTHAELIKLLSRAMAYLCLFLTLQLVPSVELQAQTKWYKLTSPDNAFVVSFPSKPNHAPQTDRRTNMQVERFSLTFKNHYMEIQYVELPDRPETRKQIEASLEGVKSGYLQALKNNRGRLLRLLNLPEGGYQFDSIVPLHDGTPAHSRARAYVLGTRQYTISCVTWNKEGLDESLAARFLNSFSFVNSSPSRPEQEKKNNNPGKFNNKAADGRLPNSKKEP